MLWVCVGGAAQVLVVSAIWSWLPSFLNREYGLAPDQAAVKAALVVLCGAIGSVVWGAVIDRAGAPARCKLYALALTTSPRCWWWCRLRHSAPRLTDHAQAGFRSSPSAAS
jgi:MFS family permease